MLGLRLCYIADAQSEHTQRWVKYFASQGCEILVISPRYEDVEGAKVIRLAAERRMMERLVEAIINAVRLRRILREYNPDIIHVHYIYNRAFPLNLAFWRIAKLVVSVWGSDIITSSSKERITKRFGKRFILKQAALLCATSHYLATQAARYVTSAKHINVIPFGIDDNLFIPDNEDSSTKDNVVTLGFVKGLEPKYGPDVLIQAMALVVARHPETRLTIAGKGSMKEELEMMVLKLGLERNVSIIGYIAHNLVPDLLKGIDIFVMPSNVEGFGVAALEAQAMEIPVVATRVGGIPEVVADGRSGILVDPGDSKQLADAIMKLIEEPTLRRTMGHEGREHVLMNYRWAENAEKMAILYRQLAGKPRPSYET